MNTCYILSSTCLAYLFQFMTWAHLNGYTVLWLSPSLRSYLQLPVIQSELTDPRSTPVLSLSLREHAARWQKFLFALSTELDACKFLYMLKTTSVL